MHREDRGGIRQERKEKRGVLQLSRYTGLCGFSQALLFLSHMQQGSLLRKGHLSISMRNASERTAKQTTLQADLGSTYRCLPAQMPTLLYRRRGAQEGPSGFSCTCLAVAGGLSGDVEGLLAQRLETEARRKQDGSATASPGKRRVQTSRDLLGAWGPRKPSTGPSSPAMDLVEINDEHAVPGGFVPPPISPCPGWDLRA